MSALDRDLVIGADPGFTGALAAYNIATRTIEDYLELPILGKGKHRQLHMEPIVFWLHLYASRAVASVLELPLAIERKDGRRQGIRSTARSWHGRGELRSALVVLRAGGLLEPAPGSWKGSMGLSADKARSVAVAGARWPGLPLRGPRGGLRDGLAEAALLALWGARAIGAAR